VSIRESIGRDQLWKKKENQEKINKRCNRKERTRENESNKQL